MPTLSTKVTQEHAVRYYALLQETNSLSAAERVKEEFGLPHAPSTIVRMSQTIKRLGDCIPDITPPLPPELVVNYQDCVVSGDCHMPYIHKPALISMLSQAQQDDIKVLVLNGDALDMDWCSHWMSLAAPGTMHEVDHHRRAIYDILHAMAGVFDKIYVLRGNHDARLMKKLDKRLSLSAVWQMFAVPADKWRGLDGEKLPNLLNVVEICERYYMEMTGSPTGLWRFTHQKNYSMIPGRVPGRMAGLEECNIVSGHTHHLAIVTSGTKSNWYGVEGGCLFNADNVEYKAMRDTLHPKSDLGWITLRRGIPSMHHYERGGE